jgi:hypothetical protein
LRAALARVYRNPEAVREAFFSTTDSRGTDEAVRLMRERPEALGWVINPERARAFRIVLVAPGVAGGPVLGEEPDSRELGVVREPLLDNRVKGSSLVGREARAGPRSLKLQHWSSTGSRHGARVAAWGSVWVSFPRQTPASVFSESGTDARISLESRHFDGLAPLSSLPLDQESPGSSPGGATESAASEFPVAALSLFAWVQLGVRTNSKLDKLLQQGATTTTFRQPAQA